VWGYAVVWRGSFDRALTLIGANPRITLQIALDECCALKANSRAKVACPAATIRPSDEKQVSTKPPPPLAGFPRYLPLLYVQLLAHDDHQSFSFLFRLRQPRNNRSKFIEHVVPAL
jgi:hypothetical protein